MDKDRTEYKAFITWVFKEYMYNHPHELYYPKFVMEERYSSRFWRDLISAAHMLNYINRFCYDAGDIYGTFTQDRIKRLSQQVSRGLALHNRLAQEWGCFRALNGHFDEIVQGMDLQDMPAEEVGVLRALGSVDPDAELAALVYQVKYRNQSTRQNTNQSTRQNTNERPISTVLKSVSEEHLEQSNGERIEQRTPRWFKGLGFIVKGTALSVANMFAACSELPLQVPTEQLAVGAVVSVAGGVGSILQGVGELRAE